MTIYIVQETFALRQGTSLKIADISSEGRILLVDNRPIDSFIMQGSRLQMVKRVE